jgi:hypothetical protein
MHQDFKELLSAFNAGQVRYLINGMDAPTLHGIVCAKVDVSSNHSTK